MQVSPTVSVENTNGNVYSDVLPIAELPKESEDTEVAGGPKNTCICRSLVATIGGVEERHQVTYDLEEGIHSSYQYSRA